MGLAYRFRGSVHYHHGRKHGSLQGDIVLEEPRVLHVDLKAARKIREHKCQPRLLHTAKLSITIDEETKIFHNKTKFTHYLSTNPALQRIITEKKKTNTRMETTS